MPHWRHPDFLDEAKSDDEADDADYVDEFGNMKLFHETYIDGIKYMLY